MRLFPRKLRLNLALQGGGAHGAFTWGVLDRLLDEDGIEPAWISGTSAGAVNAVAFACGFATGGREGARTRLREVWKAVHQAGVPDLLRFNPFLYGLTRSFSVAQVASFLSPYDFNPLGFDPLRKLLTEQIDFEAVRSYEKIELLLAATEVATGNCRLFRRREITADVVLASACLPTLHHTAQVDGVAYWDGGFSANPDILTLGCESPVRDTLIVQINPLRIRELPMSVREIAGHANRLTFNAPMRRDVEILRTVRETSRGWFGARRHRLAPLVRHRYHLIDAGRYTSALNPESKMKPDWALFTYLHQAGRTETGKWLDRHRADVGRRETAALVARYLNGEDEAWQEERTAGPQGSPAGASAAAGLEPGR